MKIKVYIVTYKKTEVLNENLKSFWKGAKHPEQLDVTILSNYPECIIDQSNKRDNLRIVFNTTRMPNAWGYLARDWNFCILDGFKTYQNPDNVDWVVMAQNDVTWVDGWDENLIKNKDFDFISQAVGDQSMAINIEAVKKVGFFDERFTTLHFQEADYFVRSIKILKERCSIYDGHKIKEGKSTLDYNPRPDFLTFKFASDFNMSDEVLHNQKNWADCNAFAISKWGRPLHGPNIDEFELREGQEINWYPFFWDGYAEKEKLFPINLPNKKKLKTKSKCYKFLHFYWLRGKK